MCPQSVQHRNNRQELSDGETAETENVLFYLLNSSFRIMLMVKCVVTG